MSGFDCVLSIFQQRKALLPCRIYVSKSVSLKNFSNKVRKHLILILFFKKHNMLLQPGGLQQVSYGILLKLMSCSSCLSELLNSPCQPDCIYASLICNNRNLLHIPIAPIVRPLFQLFFLLELYGSTK